MRQAVDIVTNRILFRLPLVVTLSNNEMLEFTVNFSKIRSRNSINLHIIESIYGKVLKWLIIVIVPKRLCDDFYDFSHAVRYIQHPVAIGSA